MTDETRRIDARTLPASVIDLPDGTALVVDGKRYTLQKGEIHIPDDLSRPGGGLSEYVDLGEYDDIEQLVPDGYRLQTFTADERVSEVARGYDLDSSIAPMKAMRDAPVSGKQLHPDTRPDPDCQPGVDVDDRTDAVARTRRYGTICRKTVYGLALLAALLLFVAADAVRVGLKRLAD